MLPELLLVSLAATAPWADRCQIHASELTELAARLDAGDESARPLLARAAQEADRDLSGPLPSGFVPHPPRLSPIEPGPDAASRARMAAHALQTSCELAGAPRTFVEPERMKEILARPDFDGFRTGPSWLMRLLNAAAAALSRLIKSDSVGEAASYVRPLTLMAVALLVLYLGLKMGRPRRQPVPSRRGSAEPDVVRLDEPALHRARGDAAIAGGLFRDGLREHLLAALSTLERAGLLRPGRARTNRECAGDLAARGAAAPLVRSFAGLAERYDRAFYGKPDLEPDEALSLIEALRGIGRQVGP